jgi:hypothetical protein
MRFTSLSLDCHGRAAEIYLHTSPKGEENDLGAHRFGGDDRPDGSRR